MKRQTPQRNAAPAARKPLLIAGLGPEGSYSHQAAVKCFGSHDQFVGCTSFPEVLDLVAQKKAHVGMLPIENSIEGGVNAAHDCLIHTDLVICGEYYLPVDNVLCAAQNHQSIQRIYSHPQPLGQCRQWLLAHYPHVEQVSVSSTSEGAHRAQTDKNAAAISSPFAASLYGLKILARRISDAEDNTTRFLVMGREPFPFKSSDKKSYKTSLLFAVAHEVGALSHILSIFASKKINLLKIASRPAPHKKWEYLFFVDVAGHQQQPALTEALNQVRKKTLWLKILGSYPEHPHV
ncbi:MAG: prephenate dehydratase [bacterium]